MKRDVRTGPPITFGVKIALAVIFSALILGAILRWIDRPDPPKQISQPERLLRFSNIDSLIPVIALSVGENAHEKEWANALAERINGEVEVRVDRGRMDVMNVYYAIEVDYLGKWHEGLGQAIHYGSESERSGVLALIDTVGNRQSSPADADLLRKIEILSNNSGVKLIILRRSE